MTSQETFLPVRPTGLKFPKWSYQADYRTVDPENVKEALSKIIKADRVAWDSEFDITSSGYVLEALSFSTRPNSGWLFPVRMEHIPNMPLDIARKFVFAIGKKRNAVQLAGAEMRSVRHTWPDEWKSLLNITDDVQVVWYQRDPNEAKDFRESKPRRRGAGLPAGFSLVQMALKYLKLEIPDLHEFFDKGGKFRQLDPETARIYGCSDADVAGRLWDAGCDQSMQENFIYKLDMAMIEVLVDAELRGIFFDKEELARIEAEVRPFVAELRAEAYNKLGMDLSVNIDSRAKLAHHMFNVLGWPGIGKKTKDGLYSTNKTNMERYSESSDPKISEAATAHREYKRWKTLHNNFLTKLSDYVNPVTGAIHCTFLQTVVPTGRLACASPNLQQIPQRNDRAPLRRAFRARPGYFFFEADYSQIELRVYAGESNERYYFDSFEGGVDLHLKTASIIYRQQITDKEDPRRQMGKTMNFGPIYGMKPEGLAMRTDYTLAEAEQILDDFFSAQPDAVQWTRDVHARTRQLGGVYTHFGRWRPLPWIHSRIPQEVEFGERSSVNTIVQGTAADISKIGLIRLYRALQATDCPFEAYLLLPIHDSVLLEVADGTDLAAFFEFVRDKLCFPVKGYPPLEIDAKTGRNWHDMTPYKSGVEEVLGEPTEPQEKSVPLPNLTEQQMGELVGLIKGSTTGEFKVTLLHSDGSPLSAPISMSSEGYNRVLLFAVAAVKANQANTPDDREESVQVSFA